MSGGWARWLERCADGSRTSSAVAALFLLVLVATGQAAPAKAEARPAAAAASVAEVVGLPAVGEIVLVARDQGAAVTGVRPSRREPRRAAHLERGWLPRPRAPTFV